VGRPVDLARRDVMLARAAQYVLANGLAGLSLRPMAEALGTSPRMLLYDFESKEKLISSILAEIRDREASLLSTHLSGVERTETGLLHYAWAWISAPEQEPFLRLFFQVYVDAISRPGAYGGAATAMVSDWLETVSLIIGGPNPTVTATLFVAVVRGLLLDGLATGERVRTNDAMERFIGLIGHSVARTTRSS
jgi:AcrR family transcriptional regulator